MGNINFGERAFVDGSTHLWCFKTFMIKASLHDTSIVLSIGIMIMDKTFAVCYEAMKTEGFLVYCIKIHAK